MKWLILLSLVAIWSQQVRSPIRGKPGQRVRGTISRSGDYEEYLGVPYAYTDREHRFQAPLPIRQWDGVLEAVNEHLRCPQRFSPTLILGQENCLTLNIYAPRNINKLLPVMVYIHGGGFREGSNSPFLYGPKYLVTKNVILVSINYRLEILGFLCLGIKEAPGNAGLKDQVQALKWIKENIEEFGGDPNEVTIFGESAGAASVSYHIISPMSKGLFNRAILQSGAAFSPWSFQYDPLDVAHKLAKSIGYNTKDPVELYKIFQNKTAEELLIARVPRAKGHTILSETLFVPCVEKEVPGLESFLSANPHDLMQKGQFNKVPVMLGFNSAEGLLFVGKENSTTIAELNIFDALPRDLDFPNEKVKKDVATKVTSLYLGQEKLNRSNLARLSGFYGDPSFKYPIIAKTNYLLEHNSFPVYNYLFSYNGWLNIAKWYFGFGKEIGATHADEVFYLFNSEFPSPSIVEREIVDEMATLWTNFAKYGNPSPPNKPAPTKWLPTNKQDPKILVIDKDFSTIPLWDGEATVFWHETYRKYRRKS